jgi:hypothetical protein
MVFAEAPAGMIVTTTQGSSLAYYRRSVLQQAQSCSQPESTPFDVVLRC